MECQSEFYLHHPKGNMMCTDFRRSFCRRGSKCKMGRSEVDREIGFINNRNEKVTKDFGEVKEVNSFEGNWEVTVGIARNGPRSW